MRRFGAAVLAAGLLLAACGGDDEEAATATGATATGATATGETATGETATGATATGATGTATGAGEEATTPPPVELEGEVNDHGTAQLSGGELDVVQGDLFFEPTFVEVTDPGAQVTVQVANEGNVEHTFTIEEQGVDLVLSPGGEGEVTVTTPETGSLTFVCRFHLAQGMQGAFFVSG